MTTATAPDQDKVLATREEPKLTPFEVIERVITAGDLATMKPDERIAFYWRTCESLGLNPLTRPFEFISLNGKLTMYARKDATDQLRKINQVTVTEIRREKDAELGLITVYARGRDKTGREDEATGVVNIKGLAGEALANGLMKAETKAKRRLTLSLVGLGFLDESELEGAAAVDVDPTTGEIVERAKPKSLLESVKAQQEALATASVDEPSAEVEGEASWIDVAAAAPTTTDPDDVDLAATLLTAAQASDLEGPASKDQLAALGAIFAGWDSEMVKAGIRIVFGAEAVGKPTAAQAAGLALVADSLGDRFAPLWGALVSGSAS